MFMIGIKGNVGVIVMMNDRTRKQRWVEIIERNGHNLCVRCGDLATDIHHINGDDRDNRIDNLDALCHGCNKLKRLQKRYLPISAREYTPEHKKNIIKEPLFRKWLEGMIYSHNYHYPLDITIRQGALEIGMSPETIKRYLSYLTDHPTAPYITKAGEFGEMEIWLKGHEPIDE